MGYLGIVNIDGTSHKVGSTLFGTCATEAATAAKVVTCSDFTELPTGVTIHVKFTYSNTATNPTLNINSKGAKAIYRYGTTVPGTTAETSWNAGAVVSFTYDGSNFMMNDWVNTNTNTDTNVTQTATNTNANYEVLFSGTADNTTRTEGARKYSNLTFNPSTGTLTTTKVVSTNATLGVADIDTANITEDNVGNLIVTGAARFLNTINGSISGNAATATLAADSSKLNGYASDTSATNNTIARRTANGYIFATYFNQSSGAETPTSSSYVIYANSDGYFRKSSIANMKTAMSLNNVENKSSATIRGELTSANVTTALGYTPVNKVGDTMSGNLTISHATNNVMTSASTNPQIIFNDSNDNQPVKLVYTDYDSYRGPAGLKVLGGTASASPAWFEVEGDIYEAGTKLGSKYLGISAKAASATVADSANAVAWGNVTGKPNEFAPSSGSSYYVKTNRGASQSTATKGDWVCMCNSSSTGSPTLPTAGKWWHIFSLDCWGSAPNNWTSQLAIATSDGNGVWWRRNDSGGTSIDSSTWHRLAEGDASGNATNANKVNNLTVQTAVPANAKFTDTTYSAGDNMTLSSTTFYATKRWNAVTQGQKWSRIMYVEPTYSIEGTNGILAVSCTRANVVCNAIFIVSTSHSSVGKISLVGSTNYSNFNIRVVVNSGGAFYFEIDDTANNIASGTSQTWHCSYLPLMSTTVTVYTAFTDGTTIPSGFTACNQVTTVTGDGVYGIRDITRSGTTFTATRSNGTTFTFTQQDSNDQFTLGTSSNSVVLSKNGTAQNTITVPYATTAAQLNGLTAQSTQTWGNQTGTLVHAENDSTGGSIAFRRDNPSSGQLSMILDGTVYIKEGGQNISEAVKSFSVSGTTITYTTLWGNTGTFTTQDTNTTYSLSADGANVKLTPSSGSATTASLNDLINGLTTGSSTPVDADYYISQYVNGGTSTTTYHRRPMSALWAYIKGKSDDVYVKKSGDSMTGTLCMNSTNGNYGEGIRINAGNGGYSSLTIGTEADSTSGITDKGFWIGTNRTNSNYMRKLYIAHNSSTASTTYFYASSASDTSPSLQVGGAIVGRGVVCTNAANSGTAGGLSLYGTDPTQYGVLFRTTANQGTHGYVTSDWATYFTMSNTANRGWVFRRNGSGNVASIDTSGQMVLNGSLTVGGNASNNAGMRLVWNSSTSSLDFVVA